MGKGKRKEGEWSDERERGSDWRMMSKKREQKKYDDKNNDKKRW